MTYVGQSVRRFEDAPLVTGQGLFLDDMSLPGMLYSAVVRSDYAHARIRSIDTSAARDLPGVIEVLTASDIAGVLEDIPSRPMASLATSRICEIGISSIACRSSAVEPIFDACDTLILVAIEVYPRL